MNAVQVLGPHSKALGDAAVSIGFAASAGTRAIAVGMDALAVGTNSTALGSWSQAQGRGSVAIGGGADANNRAQGAKAAAANSIAVGTRSSSDAAAALALGADAVAGQAGAVALGSASTTDAAVATASGTIAGTNHVYAGTAPASTVSIGKAGAERTLTHLAAGRVSASSTDAINGSQLNATNVAVTAVDGAVDRLGSDAAGRLGGGSTYDSSTGGLTAPTYNVAGKTANNVGDALTNLDGRVNQVDQRVTNLGDQLNSGSVGLVQQDAATKVITVAKDKDGKQVSFAGTEGDRVLTNIAKGAVSQASVEAVNGSQLFGTNKSVADSLGGGSKVNSDGTISGPTYTVEGKPVNNVGDAISNIDGRTTGNTTAITNLGNQLNSGSVGLVQQDATTKTITVARDRAGKQVSFLGTDGSRVLVGVARGAINETSVEAINGAQLYGTSRSVVNALGGGSKVEPNGTISAPTYTVEGKPVTNVGDAITNIDGRTTSNTTAITQLGDRINNGGLGLVKQDAASRDISVASDKDGKQVTFAGTEGVRVLAGVAKGAVDEASVQAVNGSQLHGTSKSVAAALGGGAKVNPDGTISAPTYTVDGKSVGNVGDAISNLDGRVASNTQAIQNIAGGGGVKYFRANSTAAGAQSSGANAVAAGPQAVASGTAAVAIGNGAQASADNSVAIGAGAVADRANTVAVGRAGQERTISHVAAGTADTDAVNVSQLRNTQQGTVHYDRPATGAAPDYSSLSLGGPGGATTTRVRNVSQGVAATDAVNVAQLNAGMEQAVGQSRSYTDAQVQMLGNDMWRMQRESRAGTASAIAMAGLVQAYEAGDSLMSVGVGGFQGEYGLAMGLSGVTGDGKYLYKAQASHNTRKDFGFSVSAGWRW